LNALGKLGEHARADDDSVMRRVAWQSVKALPLLDGPSRPLPPSLRPCPKPREVGRHGVFIGRQLGEAWALVGEAIPIGGAAHDRQLRHEGPQTFRPLGRTVASISASRPCARFHTLPVMPWPWILAPKVVIPVCYHVGGAEVPPPSDGTGSPRRASLASVATSARPQPSNRQRGPKHMDNIGAHRTQKAAFS
jgi:hypothetical protein